MDELTEISLSLKNVNKTFSFTDKSFHTIQQRLFNLHKKNKTQNLKALNDINIDIFKGECIGIIGRNGSGKSTLTKMMSGAYLPDKGGAVEKKGTSLLLNLGVGFSHELTARENIYVNGSTLGLRIKQIDEIYNESDEYRKAKSIKNSYIYSSKTILLNVDTILDKIGKSGYESLSKEEKETLYRASQQKD